MEFIDQKKSFYDIMFELYGEKDIRMRKTVKYREAKKQYYNKH